MVSVEEVALSAIGQYNGQLLCLSNG
jgi:hypothetical protein